MNKSEFRAELSKRFPSINPNVLSDIDEFVEAYPEDQIKAIWREFQESYDANYAPRAATFSKIAARIGAERRGRAQDWQLVCYLCTAKTGRTFKYPIDRRICPGCENNDSTMYALINPFKETDIDRARLIVQRYYPERVTWEEVSEERRNPYRD